MDADTEVYAHLTAISGHVAMVVMMVEQESVAQPLPALVGELARCTEAARQALLLRASERHVQAGVLEIASAAGRAVEACLRLHGTRASPCRVLNQIHTEAQQLAQRLKASTAPLAAPR